MVWTCFKNGWWWLGEKVLLWRSREADKEVDRDNLERIVDKDMNDLHIKPSDAMDRSKRRKWLEGVGATAIVTAMPWTEYELYVSGAGSPMLTWIGPLNEFLFYRQTNGPRFTNRQVSSLGYFWNRCAFCQMFRDSWRIKQAYSIAMSGWWSVRR